MDIKTMDHSYHAGRRAFHKTGVAATAAFAFPPALFGEDKSSAAFESLVRDLLEDWCGSMLALQIDSPADATRHGALACPSCDFIHGRCPDAVYPFLRMARSTDEERYITAAVRIIDWSKNTTLPSGAWTVVPDPTTWSGITVFGAIALAEALHHHGDLLDASIRRNWTARLRLAADFVHRTFSLNFSSIKPCVHHTFAHAKAFAWLLEHPDTLAKIDTTAPLPRATANGISDFPEIAVSLAARGPWRATISAYDWLYRPKHYQPTGGSISLLWHEKLGPVLAGSMATYIMVEKYNMQPNPDETDHPLTPRVELRQNDIWFTQLHDLQASVSHTDENEIIRYQISTRLLSEDQTHPEADPVPAELEYLIAKESLTIRCRVTHPDPAALGAAFVLPVISPTGEKARQSGERAIQIQKPGGKLTIESNVPIQIQDVPRGRIFNMVPGFEAVPIIARFAPGQLELILTLRYLP